MAIRFRERSLGRPDQPPRLAMKAIIQERYGSPDALELLDVDPPTPGEGEVLVRVRAASLHPDVWHVVCGRPHVLRLMGAGLSKPKNPIPGTDMAGVVEGVGAKATRLRPGDEVFGETVDFAWKHGGTFAEYVAVREDWLALKPHNVTFEQAASVPASGFITLLNLSNVSQLRPGGRVLVNGAGGGVGSIALQVAKARGAHVTAVDTTGKLEMLRSLGADRVIDFTREDFTRSGVRYDLVIDIPGNRPFSAFRPALEPDGRYVPIGHEHYGALGKRLFGLLPHFFKLMFLARFVSQMGGARIPPPTRQEAMATLRDLLAAGKLTPIIDSTYPLTEIREAFRHLIEDELHGKVIVTP